MVVLLMLLILLVFEKGFRFGDNGAALHMTPVMDAANGCLYVMVTVEDHARTCDDRLGTCMLTPKLLFHLRTG